MMTQIDAFRKGSVIVLVMADVSDEGVVDKTTITRDVVDYQTINKAKKANRATMYRTVPTRDRKKVNGVWVRL